ncbi:hypothetical protein [Streptomyces boncukensis]|uniref:Uncharacterized protein n=1 Tax=Streptomyces boncukensis TaxID=2711219 RepID=A0A6G4X001_9ACTN|nr:hypothetical protein [Streptomyces boncukensis]NGO70452.1 hypothetical protein [Streptomyces boncukensis]
MLGGWLAAFWTRYGRDPAGALHALRPLADPAEHHRVGSAARVRAEQEERF